MISLTLTQCVIARAKDITQHHDVPRNRLINEIMKSSSIHLLLISPDACSLLAQYC